MAIKTSGSSTAPTSAFGGGGSLQEWWQDLMTTNEIAQIRAKQEAQVLAIEKADALNQKIFGLTSELFQEVRSRIGDSREGEVPEEFDRLVSLFEQGGQFGQGAKAEIERGSEQALAAGQIGMASTGMSSGTNAAGLTSRIEADAALSKAQIEDQRVSALGGALETKGTATLAARSEANRTQTELLRTLTSLKPNFVAA